MKMISRSLAVVLAGIAATAIATGALAADISGAGATFPAPIYGKWAAAYKAATGTGVNYQAIGSGAGIAQIKAKTVTFGATDKPLQPKDLDAAGLIMFPTVIGGDVAVVNVAGVNPGDLVLDGPTLAEIFLGHITNWNDAAIKKLNPNAKLPDQAIAVVHRSDGSGTTFIWTNYLSKVSQTWLQTVGSDTAVSWPVGIGAKGNEGVANIVNQTSGAIGYVEYAYAKSSNMRYARMINHDGATVSPNLASFSAAASNVNWGGLDHFYFVLTNAAGKQSWPIAGGTFILMYKEPTDPAASATALKFFKYAYEKGGEAAKGLDYVPLPPAAVKAIETSWKQVKGSGM